jgi:hypothetical protein
VDDALASLTQRARARSAGFPYESRCFNALSLKEWNATYERAGRDASSPPGAETART